MGVDAVMAVVYTGQPLTPKQVARLSGDMVAVLGAQRFWIRGRGFLAKKHPGEHALRAVSTVGEEAARIEEDYGAGEKDWSAAWRALAVAKGWQNPDEAPMVLSDIDGLVAAPGENLLQVSLYGRYYGVGYERGHWPDYKGVAEFLEHRLRGCRVYYGGDSGGALQLCDAAFRQAMDRHFYGEGHDPYRSGFTGIFGRHTAAPVCRFCGDRTLDSTGGGQGKAFWHCAGCDDRMIVGPQDFYYPKQPEGRGAVFESWGETPDERGRIPISQLPLEELDVV